MIMTESTSDHALCIAMTLKILIKMCLHKVPLICNDRLSERRSKYHNILCKAV